MNGGILSEEEKEELLNLANSSKLKEDFDVIELKRKNVHYSLKFVILKNEDYFRYYTKG